MFLAHIGCMTLHHGASLQSFSSPSLATTYVSKRELYAASLPETELRYNFAYRDLHRPHLEGDRFRLLASTAGQYTY